MSVGEWMSGRLFQFVHQHNLVYNACWEDPRLDRVALDLGPDDTVLVITSAGCNALDYALAGPKQMIAVDLNPRQNALLELKLAGIRSLSYEDFFARFGDGRLDRAQEIYGRVLRPALSPWAQTYWDRWIQFFEPGNVRPFYFRGTCGTFAMLVNAYINRVVRLRSCVDAMLEAASVEEQRRIYEEVHDRFWTRSIRFAMRRDSTLSLLGVPRAQRRQVDTEYEGGISQFVHDCLEAVFARLPLADNYFWRVYMTGHYAPHCCPEYLKPENFERLKAGLADRIEVHTGSVQGFLENNEVDISRFVLLDHMDWLTNATPFAASGPSERMARFVSTCPRVHDTIFVVPAGRDDLATTSRQKEEGRDNPQRPTVPTRVHDKGHAGNRSGGGLRQHGLRACAAVRTCRRGRCSAGLTDFLLLQRRDPCQ